MYVADWPHINSCTNHFLFLYLQLISFIELFYGKKMVRKKSVLLKSHPVKLIIAILHILGNINDSIWYAPEMNYVYYDRILLRMVANGGVGTNFW